jgi:hypothetical protein
MVRSGTEQHTQSNGTSDPTGQLTETRDWTKTYQAISYNVVFLEHWSSHLGVLVVVVFDEVFIAHARFLLDHYRCFDDLPKTCRIWVTSFENHDYLGALLIGKDTYKT